MKEALEDTRDALRDMLTASANFKSRKLDEARVAARSAIFQANMTLAHSEEPRERRSIMDGSIVLQCPVDGVTLFYEWPRSLDYFDYECAQCGRHLSALTETGASR